MSDAGSTQRMVEKKRGYSLGSLMFLMSYIAVLLAGTRAFTTDGKNVESREVITCCVIGVIVGGMLGGGVGLFHYRRWRGLFAGCLAGIVAGGVGIPLTVLPKPALASIAATYALGSVLLVAACWMLCWFSKPHSG